MFVLNDSNENQFLSLIRTSARVDGAKIVISKEIAKELQYSLAGLRLETDVINFNPPRVLQTGSFEINGLISYFANLGWNIDDTLEWSISGFILTIKKSQKTG